MKLSSLTSNSDELNDIASMKRLFIVRHGKAEPQNGGRDMDRPWQQEVCKTPKTSVNGPRPFATRTPF